MPSFTTKQATADDIPVIVKIQEKTWEPTYGEILSKDQIDYMFEKIYAPDALKKQMDDGQLFLLLLNNGNPEGFSSVAKEEPEKFKLHKLYVLPSTQGTGAGKFLLNETENYVRSQGATTLSLNVNRYNKAKDFYEKRGFQIVCEKDIPFGPYWMNDYILEKELK